VKKVILFLSSIALLTASSVHSVEPVSQDTTNSVAVVSPTENESKKQIKRQISKKKILLAVVACAATAITVYCVVKSVNNKNQVGKSKPDAPSEANTTPRPGGLFTPAQREKLAKLKDELSQLASALPHY